MQYLKSLEKLYGVKVQLVYTADEEPFGDMHIPGAGGKFYMIEMVH